MNKLLTTMFALAVACVTVSAEAQQVTGKAQDGAKKVAMCVGCHGIIGYQASFPEIHKVPMIAGQSATYITAALTAYKGGDRKHPTMRGVAADPNLAVPSGNMPGEMRSPLSMARDQQISDYLKSRGARLTEAKMPFIDARDLPGDSEIVADLIVIGGGMAGLTIAREFAGTGRNVAILESGGKAFDPAVQELYRAEGVRGGSGNADKPT
eukprot:gene16679-22118_t